jgi:cell division protein FtsI/penicillin-binding protein 2
MNTSRIRFLRWGFVFLFAVISVRLVWIQVFEAPSLREQARAQSRMRQLLSASRGSILAADGSVLANDGPGGTRQWPWGSMALPLIGMVGRDGSGLMGLEYHWDRRLRGVQGWRVARRTGRGQAWPTFDQEGARATAGYSVITTLRPGLQVEVEKVLTETVANHGAKGGVAVVLEAATGDVVAAASVPSPANRQEMARGRVDAGLIQRTYEPGSTFKAFTLASALENRAVTLETRLEVQSSWDPGDGMRPIRDAHPNTGVFDVQWCLEQSSNVCFAQIAGRVGAEHLYKTARDFGFGTPTGVDLPGEEPGILRTVDQWSLRTLPTLAIGQEVTVTPLQLASAYAALVNNGVLMRPRLVKAVVDESGDTVERFPSRPLRQVVSARTAEGVMQALEAVVESGTGRLASLPGLRILGKTGTSQKVDAGSGKYFQDRFMASFVGVVRIRPSSLVCVVVVDDPTLNGHTGGLVAAPAFARIARFAMADPMLPWGAGAPDAPGALAAWTRAKGVRTDTAQKAKELAGLEAPG